MAKITEEYFDIIVIGAGVSGIDAAYRLQEQCPQKSYTILEGRSNIGGTWDLFKFPGIRSDSDLHTFGFPFKPWTNKKTIAEASLILDYMKETVAQFGIDKKIQFGHQVDSSEWSSEKQQWTASVTVNGSQKKKIRGQFLFWCTGYYDYKNPLSAEIPGLSDFKGLVVHPQFWPEDLDYSGKEVVVIGSGATAVTILPNMAKHAHVTMLQRSPTYVVSLPQDDAINRFFRWIMPSNLAHRAIRLRFIIFTWFSFTLFTRYPNFGRRVLRKQAERQLPKGYPMSPNFDPKYNPWEQRLCVSPGGDFYKAIKDGKADVVTDTIDTVTNNSIELKSGKTLKPDIIVTATGLKLSTAGGAKVIVDGKELNIGDLFVYRHAMLSDVPNCAMFVGYVNASWTLGADATAHYMCRLINSMDRSGAKSATPRVREPMERLPILSLNSTYIKKGGRVLPSAGNRPGWAPRDMYFTDLWEAWRGDFKDLDFARGKNQGVSKSLVEEKLKEVDSKRDSGVPSETVKVKGI